MIVFYLLSWFFITILFYHKKSLKITLIKSYIIFSLLQVVVLELLSIWSIISFCVLSFFWASLSIILLIVIAKFYGFRFILNFISDFLNYLKSINPFYYLVYIILFVTNLLYPPNNFDSLAYHLARVVHWTQNGNLNFYQTNSIRELTTPPLAEYKILHLYILNGNDRLISMVQFTSMLLIIPTLTAILDLLIKPYQKKLCLLLSIIIVPSIFMLTFQSTTTQTDLIASCFVLMLLYWGVKPILAGQLEIENILFLCFSAALTYFTKPNALVFILPTCILLGIVYLIKFKWNVLIIIPSFFLCFIAINGLFLHRIYSMYGNFLGEIAEKNINNEFTVKIMISNLIKNISMHMTMPLYGQPEFVVRIVTKLHKILGLELNNPMTSIWGEYWLDYHFNEDMVGNFFYLMIFLISFVLFCFETKEKDDNYRLIGFSYIFSLIIGYCLFSLIAPWQPWQTRLDLPWFVLTLPFVIYSLVNCDLKIQIGILNNTFHLSVFHLGIFIFLIISPILFNNPNKYPRALFINTREERYFPSYAVVKNSYISASNFIKSSGYKKIGLTFGWNDWEYPIWVLSDALKNDIQLNYLGQDYPNKGYNKLSDADVWIGIGSPDPSAVLIKDFGYLKIWKAPD